VHLLVINSQLTLANSISGGALPYTNYKNVYIIKEMITPMHALFLYVHWDENILTLMSNIYS
jgi:hypothetical protein